MAYCTLEDVQRLMQVTFSNTGRPTAEDVNGIIDDISAEIDGVAQATGYVVPITTAQALSMLRSYATYGAAVAAWHAGWVDQSLLPRVEYWTNTYSAFLSRLKNGQQELPGASADEADDVDFETVPMVRRDNYWSV